MEKIIIKGKTPQKLSSIQSEVIEKVSGCAYTFILDLYNYAKDKEDDKKTLHEWIEEFLADIEFYVTRKDRVKVLIQKKMEVDVISARDIKGKINLIIIQDGEQISIWVDEKDNYGVGKLTIGKL